MTDGSAFKDWFVRQHGPRSDNRVTDHELTSTIIEGRIAEKERDRRHQWDARYESALYAWQIKDEDKR